MAREARGERGGEGKGREGKGRKAEDKIWLRLCGCAQTHGQTHKSENSISASFTPFTWRI